MASTSSHVYCYDGNKPITVLKWKIRTGSQVLQNIVLFSYKSDGAVNDDSKDPLLRYKSNIAGTVEELFIKEGEIVQPGIKLLKVQPCTHPVIMKDLCAECGTDLRHLDRANFEKFTAATTFSMVHVVPELKVCLEQAEKLGRDDEDRLLKNRKLVLLVDLDQTLIHTTNENVLKDLPEVYHFQLYGPHSPWYHTKLRPGTLTFLQNISKYYELHICTFGARLYAHKIAQILDPDGKLFSHRILSRDECFDATSKTGNLKALFPRGDAMVCIIDDREDVWNYAPNVVHVKPYCYFFNIGDINAPPLSVGSSSIFQSMNSMIPSMEESSSKDSSSSEGLESQVKKNSKAVSENKDNKKENTSVNSEDDGNKKNVDLISSESVGVKSVVSENSVSKDSKDNEVQDDSRSTELKSLENVPAESVENSKDAEKNVASTNTSDDKVETNAKSSNSNANEKQDYSEADDYLLHLEDILINIHKEYYKQYDLLRKENNTIPDLKTLVPSVRQNVLKDCNIVFSSVIPTNCVPKTSRFWTLTESLGARVFKDLVLDSSKDRTTHVVASKLGTAKVNLAKRHEDIFVVSLEWLFCCAERWHRVDERLFPLKKDVVPPFLDGGRLYEGSIEDSYFDPTMGKSVKGWLGSKRPRVRQSKKRKQKTEEEKFSERIFVEAGLSLSQDDIEDMDREVEEACSEESDKESESNSSSELSSDESLSSGDYPRGWKKPRKETQDTENNEGGESSDAETIGSVNEEIAEAVKLEFGS